MPTIRAATEDDLPAILAITNEAILDTTALWTLVLTTWEERAAWMRTRQAEGFPVLVAEVDASVRGFASFGTFRAFDGYRHTVEHSLYVEPGAQGRGIGSALLAALVARAQADGHHVIVGAIDAANARSIALHRRAGFTEAGRLREVGRKFDRWLDLLLMQRIL